MRDQGRTYIWKVGRKEDVRKQPKDEGGGKGTEEVVCEGRKEVKEALTVFVSIRCDYGE